MAINPEREKVIDKLEKMLEFFRHAPIKNDDSLIVINEQLDDLMSSLKFVPSEPSFDSLPTEIKTDILNYLCSSGAFIAASVSQILEKDLKQLDQISLDKHCSNKHKCEETKCFMPEEFLTSAITHNLDVPLSVSYPIRNIDAEQFVKGLTNVTNLSVTDNYEARIPWYTIPEQFEDLFKELEKKGKTMDTLKFTDVDLTNFNSKAMNYLVNKVKKLTMDANDLFIKTLLQSSTDSELVCLTLRYFDDDDPDLFADFADAVCKVPSVDSWFLPPGREVETAKRLVENIQTRNIKMKSFELSEDIDWRAVLSPEELKKTLEKMEKLKLVGNFTTEQVEAAKTLPGVEADVNKISK